MILGVHPISILVMGIFNFHPIIMFLLVLFSPFQYKPLFTIVTTYKDNTPPKIVTSLNLWGLITQDNN
mgnify:CR=1 FL=1